MNAKSQERPEDDHAVSPRAEACRNVRVLLRIEALDALGRPMGDPVWLRGAAQLHPDGDGVSPPSLAVRWLADEGGRYYTLSTEELEP